MIIFKTVGYAITHTFDFTGYAKRHIYWTWVGVYFAASLAIGFLQSLAATPITDPDKLAMAQLMGDPTSTSPTWPATVFGILFLITNLSFIVRRLRDAGFDGTQTYSIGIFYFFIPVIGQLMLLKWLLTPSTTYNTWTMSTVEMQELQRDGYTS